MLSQTNSALSKFFFFQTRGRITDPWVAWIQAVALSIYPIISLPYFFPFINFPISRDRKGVVWGKGLVLGGRRTIKKKNRHIMHICHFAMQGSNYQITVCLEVDSVLCMRV